jgi:hypothetical protein
VLEVANLKGQSNGTPTATAIETACSSAETHLHAATETGFSPTETWATAHAEANKLDLGSELQPPPGHVAALVNVPANLLQGRSRSPLCLNDFQSRSVKTGDLRAIVCT